MLAIKLLMGGCMLKVKKLVLVPIIAVLMFAILMVGVSADVFAYADDDFVEEKSLVFAQITDTHYYSLSYCATEGKGDFGSALITSTKFRLESSFIFKQGLSEIVAQNPDYLVVTGDLTLDGELQSHVEMANMLRELQNTIRANGNEDFQVLVVSGNHDIYNTGAVRFDGDGVKREAPFVTRKDFVTIYSSLGFPDLTDSEIEAYYATKDLLYTCCPYQDSDAHYINSTTADGVEIEYQFEEGTNTEDYANGEMTYIAQLQQNYTFVGIDEEIGGTGFEPGHIVAGKMYDSTEDYITTKLAKDCYKGDTLVGGMHHNLVPHFDQEDTLLKDFTVSGWNSSADFIADLGIRYVFTGHMHANDISSHVSFNGNQITDIETSSLTGYAGGTRYSKLVVGKQGGTYAEQFYSKVDYVDAVDITLAFEDGYMDDTYLEVCGIKKFVEVKGGKHIMSNPSEYGVNKLFLNIVDSMVYSYIDPEFIFGLIPESIGTIVLPDSISQLVENIVRAVEEDALADYEYSGTNEEFYQEGVGYKLCGYLDDLITEALYDDITDGVTMFDFAMGGYLAHLSGDDKPLAETDASVLEGLEKLNDGTRVDILVDLLLSDTGIYPIIESLLKPLDLTQGLTDDDIKTLESLLGIISKDLDLSALKVDDIVPGVLDLLKNLMGLDLGIDLDGIALKDLLDDAIAEYVTDSFDVALGEYAGGIMGQFYIDETNDCAGTEYTLFTTTSDTVTFNSSAVISTPSIENGKLPSMIAVNFGEDASTDKNFVWFTDSRVKGTEIEYIEGAVEDIAEAKDTTIVSGTTEVYASTTTSINLIVFATTIELEMARHTVEIADLKPNTTYSYRVGSKADSYWSDTYTFTTAPAENEDFTALLISDIMCSSNATFNNIDTMLTAMSQYFDNSEYSFVVDCGNSIGNVEDINMFQGLYNNIDLWKNTTHVTAFGDKDIKMFEYDTESHYPLSDEANLDEYNYMMLHNNLSFGGEQTGATGVYYSFDYSGVHFVVLNTNDKKNGKLSVAQTEWLEADLQATDKDYIVVAMSDGIYTAGASNNDKDTIKLREQLSPIFYDNGVSIVLQSGECTYSETYYLNGEGEAVSEEAHTSEVTNNGVLYVSLGAFGDTYHAYNADEYIPMAFGQKIQTEGLTDSTFGILKYESGVLYYEGYQFQKESGEVVPIHEVGKNNIDWVGIIIISSIAGVIILTIIGTFIYCKIKYKKK